MAVGRLPMRVPTAKIPRSRCEGLRGLGTEAKAYALR